MVYCIYTLRYIDKQDETIILSGCYHRSNMQSHTQQYIHPQVQYTHPYVLLLVYAFQFFTLSTKYFDYVIPI